MTYTDLCSMDEEGAFLMWKPVRQAKADGSIPKEFHDYFKDECKCGSENIICNDLTHLTCCNPRCPIKQGFAIAEMFKRFGIKGLREATCGKIYQEIRRKNDMLIKQGKPAILENSSYVSVLGVNWEDYPTSVAYTVKGAEFFQACSTIMQKSLTFPRIISCIAIPEIKDNAEKLFSGVDNALDLKKEIDRCGSVKAYCNLRGCDSPMVAFHVRNSLLDIVTANLLFLSRIQKEGGIKLNVCMTGAITHNGIRTTKDQYIQKCNALCVGKDGTKLFEIKMNTAIESNSFILFSRPSGDRKFVAGKARGDVNDMYGRHPVLMHVDTFYNYLERVMEKWNQLEVTEEPTMKCDRLQQILTTSMEETLNSMT